MKTLFLDFDEEKIISNLPERLPLFPLDNVVFFPNTILPLHIFEQRYKQMVSDSSNTHNLICMTLYNPELGEDDSQVLSNIGCIGRIINNEEAEDGKKNIILYGLRRMHITKVLYDKPYREAQIKIIKSSDSVNADAYKKRILDLINKWNLLLEGYTEDYKIKIEPTYSLSKITDTLSSSMVSKASDRQLLLEEIDESIRAEKIIDVLESRIEILSGKIELPDKDSTLFN